MKRILLFTLVLSALLAVQSGLAAEADLAKLAAANNTFAFRLLKELNTENPTTNLFVSPYSASTALQMVANGANGQTKAEMQKVLATSDFSSATLDAASQAAAHLLNAPNANVILSTANALWYRQSAQIKLDFLAANQKYFGATIQPLNFGNAPAAEAVINQWASDQTHGRITGIANGLIHPVYTDLVLVNAIYFKGKWLDPFEEELTKERPFHPANGMAQNVPMMEMLNEFSYCNGAGYQAVRLPYMGGDLAMYVFLPAINSNPAKLLQIMNGDTWQRVIVPGFSPLGGLLVLPKFKLELTYELASPLKNLGMKLPFEPGQADFSEMFSDPHYISAVRQKTFVEVGEEGTEAAAATIVAVGATCPEPMMPPKSFEMVVDRPFLFAIVEARSQMILFAGVINHL